MSKLLRVTMLGVALVAAPVTGHAQSGGSDSDAFMAAVKQFDAPTAMSMLRRPGNRLVDTRDRNGDAAIHLSVRDRRLNWVEALAGFNANLDLGDGQGNTALILAARTGQNEIAGRLLGYGASVDTANRRGETALIVAVQARNEALVELLLKKGADPDLADHVAGLSARDYATRDTRTPRLLQLIETTDAPADFTFGPVLRPAG